MTTTTAVMAMAAAVAGSAGEGSGGEERAGEGGGSAGVYTGSVEFEERDVEEDTCYAMLYIYMEGMCTATILYVMHHTFHNKWCCDFLGHSILILSHH